MSEEDGPRVRRAEDDRDLGHRHPWSSSRPAGPVSGSPVPPPVPVLPPSEGQKTRGRRYAADDLPGNWTSPLPRRSASSPSGTRERSPGTPSEARGPATASHGAGAPVAPGRGRRRGRWLLVLLLALGLVAGTAFFALRFWAPRPPAAPAPTVDPVEAALMLPADLAALRPAWTVSRTDLAPTATSPQPRCLSPVAADPAAASRAVRTLAAEGTPNAAVLHRIDTYPDEAAAEAAFAAQSAQLGSCPGLYLARGHQMRGLSDESVGVDARVEQSTPEHHTIVLARTGRFVNIVDATQEGRPLAAGSVAAAASPSMERQCGPAGGRCPTGPSVTSGGLPPAGVPAGWLTPGDIPRVTQGAGTWRGADLPTMRLPGSQCEGVDLTRVPGATRARQRTYLLTDDPSAPRGFGVDEAVYDFPSPAAARAFTTQVAASLRDCPKRTGTAVVRQTGASPAPSSGATFVVQQQVSAGSSARFRVTVVARDDKVAFLLANPSQSFDFTDASFNAAANRAADRLTQLR